MKQIKSFWNWFQDNEEAIQNALLLGINAKEVITHLNRNYGYISKRIGFLIYAPEKDSDKYTIIFTANGYSKLFHKLIALEEQAPKLKYFIPQAFIKPMLEVSKYKEGKDLPRLFQNYEFKISQLQFALENYNIETKHLKIKIYLPAFDEIKQFEELETDIKYIVMEIIGEIAFRKHIKHIQLDQLQPTQKGLLNLIELPHYIDYLYKINSRGKTRIM
jgi:hypothetical protein